MERYDLNMSSKKRRVVSSITGDISNPKGEGSSSKVVQTNSPAAKFTDNDVCRLYFKGLVSDETVVVDGGEKTVTAGFGVAICDQKDNLLYEIKEPLNDAVISRKGVEIIALIRGLNESLALGIRNVVIYFDDHMIYQIIIGRGKIKPKIVHLVEEVQCLREKMASSEVVLIPRNDVKFAFKLAREAIVSQSSSIVDVMKATQKETCTICLEETDAERTFFTDKCPHRHCFSCVKQFVEVTLLSGIAPTCLNDECKLELTLETCSKVLTSKLIDMWKQKMKEDSIPANERIYCPYPSCSMLMSKTDLSTETDKFNVRSCVKCCGLFCIDCKVPSHSDMSCADYKKLHPDPLVDDMKLKSLANDNMWRQCVKCRHMIELSQGCNHMTCRCGYEFCYECGIEWKKDQQSCPTGCLRFGHGGDEDEDDDDDDDSEHNCEEDMCECYYDEDGVRWDDWEDFVDHQVQDYVVEEDVVYEYPPPEHFISEEENGEGNDDNWDDYNNFGGLTDSGGEGGFDEDFYRDYYTL